MTPMFAPHHPPMISDFGAVGGIGRDVRRAWPGILGNFLEYFFTFFSVFRGDCYTIFSLLAIPPKSLNFFLALGKLASIPLYPESGRRGQGPFAWMTPTGLTLKRLSLRNLLLQRLLQGSLS